MTPSGGFTEAVRQELASLDVGDVTFASAELAAIAAVRGSIIAARRPDGRIADDAGELEVTTVSGAVARRTHTLISRVVGWPPQLMVRSAGGLNRRTTYRVSCALSEPLRAVLGVTEGLFSSGSPPPVGPDADPPSARYRAAWLRGAILGAASLSAPDRSPHLEIRVERPEITALLCEHLENVIDARPLVIDGHQSQADRIVLKSGEAIGDLLVLIGASSAFLVWDERRLRRQLRGDANRLANADTANVERSVRAADRQVRQIEIVVERWGWEVLDEATRKVALARMANPTASLAELGGLLDPPVSKATVARRLQRIMARVDEQR